MPRYNERPETIDSGFGKLVNTEIEDNLNFLFEKNDHNLENPYGTNVVKKNYFYIRK